MKTNNTAKATIMPAKEHRSNKSIFSRSSFQSFVQCTWVAFLTLFMASTSWGQIAQRGSSTTASAASTNSTTITIDKPTGVIIGDVMILSIVQNETDNDNGGLASPTLSGWTLVKDVTIRSEGTSNGDNLWFGSVYYRIADGSEGSSYSFAMHSRCDMAIGSIVAFSGVATNALKPDGTAGGPFDVVPSSFNNANSATATATGLTVLTNNSAVIMVAMVNNDRSFSSWSNSQTELFDNVTTNEDDASVGAAWSSCATSGATGNGTVTISNSDRNTALLLVLRRATVLSVGAASSSPTVCVNTALTNITHTTAGATGIGTATGLPSGVTASWTSNTITISGTPSAIGTFNYSIPVNTGCINATGTITVLPSPTVVSASSSASTICAGGSVNLTSSATSNSNTTTTLLNENFNSTPTGWTTTNTSNGGTTGNAAWSLRANGYSYTYVSDPAVIFNSNDNSQFYLTNSASQGSGANTQTTLRSPSFSTVGLSAASLSFYQYFRSYPGTSAIIEISTNGTSWTALANYTTDKGNISPFVQETINLSSYLNQASVSIRFRYDGGWGWYWAVDNVSITGTLSTPPAASYAWTSSPGAFTSSTQNPTGVSPSATTTYTVTATNNYGCTATASTTVTVNSVTSGSIGSNQTICSGGNPVAFTSTAGTGSGTITYRWERNTNLTTPSWSTIASETVATYDVPSGLTTTTQYRRITISTLNSVACESAATSTVQVTVQSAVTAGAIGSAQTICSGGDPTAFTSTTNSTGSGTLSYRWEQNTNLTTPSWATIASQTADTYNVPSGLTTTTQYRRITISTLNSVACESAATSTVQVTVNPTSVGGTIAGSATVCTGTNSTTLTLSGHTGSITRWESSTSSNFSSAVTNITNITTSLIATNLTTTTYYRAVVTSGSCAPVNSATGTITVTSANTVGAASSTPTSCIYNAITNITHTTTGATGISNSGVAGANGLPSGVAASWASNTITISGTPWVSGTFNYTIPLTGGCGSVSATGTITIKATPTGNFSYSNYGFCSSVNTSQAITSNFTDATGTFSAAAGLNLNTTTGGITPSLSSPNAYVVTYSIPASTGCPSYSTTTNVTIDQAGSGTITYIPSTICINASGTVSPTITNAGGSGTPWFTVSPNGLNIDNSGVITPIGSAAGTYTITYNRPSSGLCAAYSNSTTVNISALASNTVGAASSNPTLCVNTALTNITRTTTGATGIGTATGLPAGVTASWASNTITISGNPTAGGTYNYSIPLTGGCGSVNATGTITVSQPSTTISINGTTIGNGDYLWNGNLNTNGNVKNNWYVLNNGVYSIPTEVPQPTDEVFVVSAATAISCVSNSNNFSIPAAGNFNSSNIYIGASAIVTLENGASLNVKGDFINDGNFNAGTGTVVLNGTSLQKIKGLITTTTFNNLTINNSTGVLFEKSVVVNGVLTLTSGRISLGSNNLTLGTSATVSGTLSSSNMIVASGTGELRKQFSAGTYNPASFTFPVGTSNGTNKYNPVILDFVSGTFGASAYVGVRVQDQKNPLLHSDNTTYINKTWIVEPNNDVTDFDYNIKLYFNPTTIAQGGDFVSTSGQVIGDLIPVKYSGGQWYQPIDGTFSNSLAQGTAGAIITDFLTWDGLSTFSEFGGVGSSNNPLPVELISFNGTCNEGMVNLLWQTASEFNSSHFDVEKSTDGETWRVLATIPSAGTSNELLTYQTEDNNGTNGANYYRLRQVDIDGKEKLYDPINVSCVETTAGYFTSYPNPSGNEFQVVVNNKEILGACILNIVDVHGKVIDQRSIDMKDGINMFVINETLNPGIYFLNITNGIKSTQVIKHAVK